MTRGIPRRRKSIHWLLFLRPGGRTTFPVLLIGLILGSGDPCGAQQPTVLPASSGEALPPAVIEGLDMRPVAPLEFSRAWLAKSDAVRRRRADLQAAGRLDGMAPAELARHGASLAGELRIPVIAVRYADVPDPFPVEALMDRLFGPSRGDTVSLADYWREVSGGQLRVDGLVTSWIPLRRPARHYLSAAEYGWARFGRIGELRRQVLEVADEAIDFSRFDNDGPDGVPNSGDDDGYVDFVAFFYAAQCGQPTRDGAIWPHRGAMAPFETSSAAAGGGRIRIADYVILPAQDPRTCGPAHVGVLAHEVAHAFGLPDLYDYDGSSRGIGSWGLMGTGSHSSPHSPAHPSAWAKEQMGWAQVDWLARGTAARVPPVQRTGRILRHDLGDGSGRYLLLENRAAQGSDRDLPGHGLLVWSIDPERGELGAWNGDERRPAVSLVGVDRSGALVPLDGHDASGPFPRLGTSGSAESLPLRVAVSRTGDDTTVELRTLDGVLPGERDLRLSGVEGGKSIRRSVPVRSAPESGGGSWIARSGARWLRLLPGGEALGVEAEPYGLPAGAYADTLELVDPETGRVSDRLTVHFEVAVQGHAATVAEDLPWGWGLAVSPDGDLLHASYGWDAFGLRPRPRLLRVPGGSGLPRTLSRLPADALYSPVAEAGGATSVIAHARGRNIVYRVAADGSAAVVAADIGDGPAYGLTRLDDGTLLLATWSGTLFRIDERGAIHEWMRLDRATYQLAADHEGGFYAALLSGEVLHVSAIGRTRTLDTGFDHGGLVTVATSPDGRAFAAERGGEGRIIELTVLGPRVVSRVPQAEFYGLTVDGGFLYALDMGHRRLIRLPIGLPGVRRLAGEQPAPAGEPGSSTLR